MFPKWSWSRRRPTVTIDGVLLVGAEGTPSSERPIAFRLEELAKAPPVSEGDPENTPSWDSETYTWLMRYRLITDFARMYGRLPEVYAPDGSVRDRIISRWIHEQREEFRTATINVNRGILLDYIEEWAWY